MWGGPWQKGQKALCRGSAASQRQQTAPGGSGLPRLSGGVLCGESLGRNREGKPESLTLEMVGDVRGASVREQEGVDRRV